MSKLQMSPASNIISAAAKKSGYSAKPGESIGVCSPRCLAITLCIRSSNAPVQALAILDVSKEKFKKQGMEDNSINCYCRVFTNIKGLNVTVVI